MPIVDTLYQHEALNVAVISPIAVANSNANARNGHESVHETVLTLKHVSAGYGHHRAIADVTISIEQGKRVALIGPTGAGKTTLFRSIVGLITPSSGEILINGKLDSQARRQAAYVPQFEDVDWEFPVAVIDVVIMGLARRIGWLRLPNKQHREIALEALQQVGLVDLAKRQIGELSGGQKRRVFIARALAQGASILLLDEPFSGVDVLAQQTLFEILDRLSARGTTVLLATHDLNLVSSHFDELLILNKRLIAYGKPDEVFKPDIMAAAFGGQIAIWHSDGQVIMLTDQHS
jgi:ABC-type Mn2+/Zn2+ transport system ATPase subunit